MTVVFKIFRLAEWLEVAKRGTFPGSPDDVRDGFIHLSSPKQLQGTLDKHFADEHLIVLAEFAPEALGGALKYEPSRAGELFPHYYAELSASYMRAAWRLVRGKNGFDVRIAAKAHVT